jgi:hypothetical protein
VARQPNYSEVANSHGLFGWVARTLAGHVVFLEVRFALPMFALAVTGGMAAILAALCWYTLTRPLIATYSKRK